MRKEILHVDVHREDDAYWAHVRDLRGCFAARDNVAELIECIDEGIVLYLARPGSPLHPTAAMRLVGLDLAFGALLG